MRPKKPNAGSAAADGGLRAAAKSVLSSGRPAALLVFRSSRLPEIRAQSGTAIAERLLGQLFDVLAAHLGPSDKLARLDDDSIGVLLPDEGARSAREAALRLQRAVIASHRFPVTVGLAQGRPGSSAEALLSKTRRRGLKPPAAAAPDDSMSATLAARYQRLVLLNRMSHELFGERPFAERLATACNLALALTGAKHVAVHFVDDLGRPTAFCRHGDSVFSAEVARIEEDLAVRRALESPQVVVSSGCFGWLAAALPAGTAGGPAGAVVVGYPAPVAAAGEREQTLREIARQLGDARLIQRNLEQRGMMAAVTQQSADAIIVVDLEGRVASWNPKAETLFGVARAQALGRPAAEFLPDGKGEQLARRGDGSAVDVEVTVTPLQDDAGRPFGTVYVARDITKRKELARMKDELINLVSHELRTPLTAIQGFAEALKEFGASLPPQKAASYLDIILDEASRLGELVTNFLDVSSLEAGALKPRRKRFALADVLARVERLFPGRVSARVKRGAQVVWADPEQLQRLLVNLCANAVKFSPAGAPVEVTARRIKGALELRVKDHGPGIPKDAQARLFQKFYRVPGLSAGKPGSGLGLAICKGIVDAHGGRMWVESRPGAGATFALTLPQD